MIIILITSVRLCFNPLQPTTFAFRLMTLPGNGEYVTGGSGWVDYVFFTSFATPTLISPGNTSTLVNNRTNDNLTGPYHPYPLFQWASVAGATSYVLEVSTATNFSTLYLNVNVPTTNTLSSVEELQSSGIRLLRICPWIPLSIGRLKHLVLVRTPQAAGAFVDLAIVHSTRALDLPRLQCRYQCHQSDRAFTYPGR